MQQAAETSNIMCVFTTCKPHRRHPSDSCSSSDHLLNPKSTNQGQEGTKNSCFQAMQKRRSSSAAHHCSASCSIHCNPRLRIVVTLLQLHEGSSAATPSATAQAYNSVGCCHVAAAQAYTFRTHPINTYSFISVISNSSCQCKQFVMHPAAAAAFYNSCYLFLQLPYDFS